MNHSGAITRTEFRQTIENLLFPMVTESDLDLVFRLADKNNSRTINYDEFREFMDFKVIMGDSLEILNSSLYPKDSFHYLMNKSLEIGIDLYEQYREIDTSLIGGISKERFSSLVLSAPLGISRTELNRLLDNEVLYSFRGDIDYPSLFQTETYKNLVSVAIKLGKIPNKPLFDTEFVVIEDFSLIPESNLLAYSCRVPETSMISIKDFHGALKGKLVGHWNSCPPALLYVDSVKILISGERREYMKEDPSHISCSPPPCEILLWNIQRDFSQESPPCVVKPFKKVYAHEGSIVSLVYLGISQVVVSVGADNFIRMWDPTGTPYRLSSTFSGTGTEHYKPKGLQHTMTNEMFAKAGEIRVKHHEEYRILGVEYESNEWLLSVGSGDIKVWGVSRLILLVPAYQHDRNVPQNVYENALKLVTKRRKTSMAKYSENTLTRRNHLEEGVADQRAQYEKLKRAFIRYTLLGKKPEEFRKFLADFPYKERLMNIVLLNNGPCSELQKLVKPAPSAETLLGVLKANNPFQVIHSLSDCIQDLSEKYNSFIVSGRIKRGVDIYSIQQETIGCLGPLTTLLTRFEQQLNTIFQYTQFHLPLASRGPPPILPNKAPLHTYNTRVQVLQGLNSQFEGDFIGTLKLFFSKDMSEAFKKLIATEQCNVKDLKVLFDSIKMRLALDSGNSSVIKDIYFTPIINASGEEPPPNIITSKLSGPLFTLCKEFSTANVEYLESLIKYTQTCMVSTSENHSPAESSSDAQKEKLLEKALASPMAAAIKQIVHENVLDMLTTLSLRSFSAGCPSPLLLYLEVLTSLVYDLVSFASPISPYVSTIIENLLKLFIGEEYSFDPANDTTEYVLRHSYWSPALYDAVAPLYRDAISESGHGQHYYSVIKDFIRVNRNFEYFSEVFSVGKCLAELTRPGSSRKQLEALRHLRTMLQTRNEAKTRAALHLRIPRVTSQFMQDPNEELRKEAVLIMYELSKGCTSEELEPLQGKSPPNSLKRLAKCFESPLYILPIVQLLKAQREPFVNKEAAARALISTLQGTEKMLQSALHPCTDTLHTLCKCLVATSRTADPLSAKTLGPIIAPHFQSLLRTAPPTLVKTLQGIPGSEALLKEQSLTCPPVISLNVLRELIPLTVSESSDFTLLFTQLRNWLKFAYKDNEKLLGPAEEVVKRALRTVQSAVLTRKQVSLFLELVEWLVAHHCDFGWAGPENLRWVLGLPKDQETQCCLILARVLQRGDSLGTLLQIEWGKVLGGLLLQQFLRLKELRTPSESLSELSEVVLSCLFHTLKHPELQLQLRETELTSKLVGKYLGDVRTLGSQKQSLLEFPRYRESTPVRTLSTDALKLIFSAKGAVYEDLLAQLALHKTVQRELSNMSSKDFSVAATSCELFSVFFTQEDLALECLLAESGALISIQRALQGRRLLQCNFPALSSSLSS